LADGKEGVGKDYITIDKKFFIRFIRALIYFWLVDTEAEGGIEGEHHMWRRMMRIIEGTFYPDRVKLAIARRVIYRILPEIQRRYVKDGDLTDN